MGSKETARQGVEQGVETNFKNGKRNKVNKWNGETKNWKCYQCCCFLLLFVVDAVVVVVVVACHFCCCTKEGGSRGAQW